jgi:hypothetical protein
MPVRYPPNQPGTALRAPAQAGHVGGGAGLVDKHQPTRIKPRLEALPHLPCRRHVGALLLGGVHGFFKADAVPVEKPPDRASGAPAHPVGPASTIRVKSSSEYGEIMANTTNYYS